MIPVTINRKSWHYRLATVYGGEFECNIHDLCSYTKTVLKGAFWVLGLVAAGGSVVSGIGKAVIWLIVRLQYHTQLEPDSHAVVGLAVITAAGLIGICVLVANLHSKWKDSQYQRKLLEGRSVLIKKPSFIQEAYKSFKEKTCMRIEFSEDDAS